MAWWPLAAAVCWGGLMWLIDWWAEVRYRRLWDRYFPHAPPVAEITHTPLAERAVCQVFCLYHLPAIVMIVGAVQPEPGTAAVRWTQAAIIGTTGAVYAGLLTLLA